MQPIRVLIVDDSPEFVEAAEQFLEFEPGLSIVGRAYSGQDALLQMQYYAVDLVLMDLMMPDMDGVQATRLIKKQADPPRVIIMTLYDATDYWSGATEAGADAILNKSEMAMHLLPTIESLFANATAPSAQ
jgi:DNA-binding NarL/FixJ family response regulator